MSRRLTRSCRALVVGIVAAAATLSMTQVAQADPAGPSLPLNSPIAVDTAKNQVFLVGHATGVQIYECQATATGVSWTLVAPRAELVDDKGKVVATHFAGPTWQARDGSTVVGARVAGVDAPNPPEPSIQWLKLSAKSTAKGSKGGDEFVKTTFIQRVNTLGGVAPTTNCKAGDKSEVKYTADYYFWMAAKPGA
jgi:Protein of unknown function (DUF3455)